MTLRPCNKLPWPLMNRAGMALKQQPGGVQLLLIPPTLNKHSNTSHHIIHPFLQSMSIIMHPGIHHTTNLTLLSNILFLCHSSHLICHHQCLFLTAPVAGLLWQCLFLTTVAAGVVYTSGQQNQCKEKASSQTSHNPGGIARIDTKMG
jgi:hypothetical protein